MVIVIDIDDTICFPRHQFKDATNKYFHAEPNWTVIEKIRAAKQAGCKIILYTARRMLTHQGNLNLIIREVGDLTVDWLRRHEVPYDQLIFGKPYGDIYVDDKAGDSIDRFLAMEFNRCENTL